MRASIKLEGMDDLIAGLKNLSEQSKTRITRNAARAGANELKRKLKQAAPKGESSEASEKYGKLSSNIKIEQLKAKTYLPYYRVTTGDAFWGSFLDTGTGKYNVDPGPKAKGPSAKTHIKPNYWHRKTVEQSRDQITKRMSDSMDRSIMREVAKIK